MGEGGHDVSQHGGVDFTFNVVPIKVDAQVFGARPIIRDGVVRGQDTHEVFGMLFADVFDAKSSTQRVNNMGRHLCIQNTGVSFNCV